MSKPLNILISGSGIAGSVFASCILRAYSDAIITIVERAPSFQLTGASVDIRPPAIDIVKWMGLEPEIRKHITKEEGVAFVQANGNPIATFRASGRSDVQSITSEYEIFRGALAKVFIEPIADRVNIIFNETVEHYEQHDDGVTVTFASEKKATYDLLVAADGLGSKIRGSMLGANPRDQIHDEGMHVAYFTVKKDLLQGSRLAKWRTLPGGRVVFLRPDPHPEGRTRANLMNVTWRSDTQMKDRLNAAQEEGNESYRQLLEELFHGGDWLTSEVLNGMRESDDFYCSLFAQVRSPRLCDRRVVLLGDAGYATPGVGTSLAIYGGYVLAGELLKHPNDLRAGTTEYEKVLLKLVREFQHDDIAMQLLNPQSNWGIQIRNAFLWLITTFMLDRLVMFAIAKFGLGGGTPKPPKYPWPPLPAVKDRADVIKS